MNSRPLTVASDGTNDLELINPIPSFMKPKWSPNYQLCIFQEQKISLRKKWKGTFAFRSIMVSYPASPDLFQVFCHELLVFFSFLYWYFHFQVPSSSITGVSQFIFGLFNLVLPGSSFSTSLTFFLNYKIYFFFLIIIIYLH